MEKINPAKKGYQNLEKIYSVIEPVYLGLVKVKINGKLYTDKNYRIKLINNLKQK